MCEYLKLRANEKLIIICPEHSDRLGQPSRDTAACAAPELLEVARLVEVCRGNNWEWGTDMEKLQDLARIAIAKAEKVRP